VCGEWVRSVDAARGSSWIRETSYRGAAILKFAIRWDASRDAERRRGSRPLGSAVRPTASHVCMATPRRFNAFRGTRHPDRSDGPSEDRLQALSFEHLDQRGAIEP
jgi:hypothetical protein